MRSCYLLLIVVMLMHHKPFVYHKLELFSFLKEYSIC